MRINVSWLCDALRGEALRPPKLPSSLKAGPQSCSPKLFSKIIPKATPQNYPIITENCSTKFLVNVCLKAAVLQSKWSSKLFRKVVQSCSPKLFPEAAPQNCSPVLLSKAIAPKLQFFKSIPRNGSRKLLPKVAAESCSPKWFVKLPPKAAPQSRCSSK